MQLPVGLMADSWGPRKTVSVFFVLAGIGSVLMGIAPNLSVAIIGRVLVGLGVSDVFVPAFFFKSVQLVEDEGAHPALAVAARPSAQP